MSVDPSSWLIENTDLLPPAGRALDVACGKGRHAMSLAREGYDVRAIDRNPAAIELLQETARRLGCRVDAEVVDLETVPPPSLGTAEFDVVVVFNYLHRPLMASIRAAVKPGGRLFYETFTTRQAERGHPRNPDFLLKDGELAELVKPFRVLRSREGDVNGRFVASIVAERAS